MQTVTATSDKLDKFKFAQRVSDTQTDSEMDFVTSCDEIAVINADAFSRGRMATGSRFSIRDEWVGLQKSAYRCCKRSVDIAVSLMALVLLSPVFLLAAVLIKRHDRGPVFFSQDRVGKNGRVFRCFKFRSMVNNAQSLQQSLMQQSKHADARTFKMANDPRITPPGRFMRRFSIDELPQIMNVLLGDMSVVGPRPPLPSETKLYSRSDFRRLEVKPGLTCIWQISGRSRLPFPEQVKLDLEYISRQSLLLDIAIILRTVPAVLSGDGAE